MNRLPICAFIGFGELAGVLARGLADAGVETVRAFARERTDQDGAKELEDRFRLAGVDRAPSLESALVGADIVIAAVPSAAAEEVAACACQWLSAGSLYVDPAPLPPDRKRALSERLASVAVDYVDVAIVGTVASDGFAVRTLASGPGSLRWRDTVEPLGMNVILVEGPPGQASLVKLLRSVYLKGRDALLVEMLVAARRFGVLEQVLQSFGGKGERASFPDLAERVIAGVAVHAERRAHELAAGADLLEEIGVEPIAARAGSLRLSKVAELGLREVLHGARPVDLATALELIDDVDRGASAGRDGPGTLRGSERRPVSPAEAP